MTGVIGVGLAVKEHLKPLCFSCSQTPRQSSPLATNISICTYLVAAARIALQRLGEPLVGRSGRRRLANCQRRGQGRRRRGWQRQRGHLHSGWAAQRVGIHGCRFAAFTSGVRGLEWSSGGWRATCTCFTGNLLVVLVSLSHLLLRPISLPELACNYRMASLSFRAEPGSLTLLNATTPAASTEKRPTKSW